MAATNKIRIATADRSGALDLACSEVESAVGMSVQPVFQEIEGNCLILEFRLGSEAVQSPLPTRLAIAVDNGARDVQVLSAWNEQDSSEPTPKGCHNVLGLLFDTMPPVAHRAVIDKLPTAQWDHSDASWQLAVPSVLATRPLVGLSRRRGYSQRFTFFEAAAIRSGLAWS